MVDFIIYDLTFLVLFTIVVIFLLYKNRENLKRHGWIFLYHSKFGLKFIEWVAKTFKTILKPLQYLVIACGYVLMGVMVWMMSLSAWKYVTSPIPKQLENLPPIAPLIPYFPRLFNLESIFPPLFFTYFLVALAIVAISHEFAHGIFARLNNIKVKTTGLAFFGPFFGAFVEPDEKQMAKSKKFPQLSILAAGTFANVVMTVLFILILWAFFAMSFVPAGINFNTYPQAVIGTGNVTSINGNFIDDFSDVGEFIDEEDLNEIGTVDGDYLAPSDSIIYVLENEAEQMIVFEDAPAVRARLRSPILAIDGIKIIDPSELGVILEGYSPGDEIEVTTLDEQGISLTENIVLGEVNGKAYLGVGFIDGNNGGFSGLIFGFVKKVRDPLVYYEPAWDGDFVQFIYDLLWWIVVINILVALFNMLPVSILDGGRFFYLTVWGITGNEKIGKKAFSLATWFIVLLLAAMMVKWLWVFIS